MPRTLVMGILNVTEDSFSDGGTWTTTDLALGHAREMVAAGADIIDVGGESTRPGATRVSPETERDRIVPVIGALRAEGVTTSIDTMRAATAAAAVRVGVDIVNDVSGGLADPEMDRVVAEANRRRPVDYCLMHWRTAEFASAAGGGDHGGDVVADVRTLLAEDAARAVRAGVPRERIIMDPGIGFAKTADENWALLHALPTLVADWADDGYRTLVGASRKRFLTALRPGADGEPGSPVSADDATAAVSTLSASACAWAVRVHAVAANRAAVDVADCVGAGTGPALPEGWRARRG
jgi:dihydropteroate synthase